MGFGIAPALRAAVLLIAVRSGVQETPSRDPGEEALAASLEAGRAAALARVEDARASLDRELQESADRERRIEAALRELTSRSPLKLALPGGITLDGVRVEAFRGDRFTLVWPQGRVEVPFASLPEESRQALLGNYFGKATPRDLLEIGRRLLKIRDFDRAARWIEAASRKDPALAPLCPDLQRLKRASRLFEGGFRVVGSTLSLRWTFATAGEAGDFAVLKGTSMSVKSGKGLEVDARDLALIAVKGIPFRERVKASALGLETEACVSSSRAGATSSSTAPSSPPTRPFSSTGWRTGRSGSSCLSRRARRGTASLSSSLKAVSCTRSGRRSCGPATRGASRRSK
jgi:hypothetical protein